MDSESPLENESAKKCVVTIAMVKKWIVENDKDIATSTWLVYDTSDDTSDREHVSALKCSICVLFKDKLQGLRNYNPAFITRAPPTFKTTSAVTVSEPEPAYTFSLEDWDTLLRTMSIMHN